MGGEGPVPLAAPRPAREEDGGILQSRAPRREDPPRCQLPGAPSPTRRLGVEPGHPLRLPQRVPQATPPRDVTRVVTPLP